MYSKHGEAKFQNMRPAKILQETDNFQVEADGFFNRAVWYPSLEYKQTGVRQRAFFCVINNFM